MGENKKDKGRNKKWLIVAALIIALIIVYSSYHAEKVEIGGGPTLYCCGTGCQAGTVCQVNSPTIQNNSTQ
jgi:hypothetical protein